MPKLKTSFWGSLFIAVNHCSDLKFYDIYVAKANLNNIIAVFKKTKNKTSKHVGLYNF